MFLDKNEDDAFVAQESNYGKKQKIIGALLGGALIGAGIVSFCNYRSTPAEVATPKFGKTTVSLYQYMTPAYDKGASGCTPQNPCDVGGSDCDTNADCKGGLMCWQKDNNQRPIPGVTGFQNIRYDFDFCYDPFAKGNFLSLPEAFPGAYADRVDFCTEAKPCSIGEGDCDNDNQCAGKLKCFQRNVRRSIPGVYAEHLPAKFDNWDFCYDPDYWQYSKMYAAQRGPDGCNPSNPCTVGEADCDSDNDCAGSLKCHQRGDNSGISNYAPTPGVLGEDTLEWNYDICYDPALGNIN